MGFPIPLFTPGFQIPIGGNFVFNHLNWKEVISGLGFPHNAASASHLNGYRSGSLLKAWLHQVENAEGVKNFLNSAINRAAVCMGFSAEKFVLL